MMPSDYCRRYGGTKEEEKEEKKNTNEQGRDENIPWSRILRRTINIGTPRRVFVKKLARKENQGEKAGWED